MTRPSTDAACEGGRGERENAPVRAPSPLLPSRLVSFPFLSSPHFPLPPVSSLFSSSSFPLNQSYNFPSFMSPLIFRSHFLPVFLIFLVFSRRFCVTFPASIMSARCTSVITTGKGYAPVGLLAFKGNRSGRRPLGNGKRKKNKNNTFLRRAIPRRFLSRKTGFLQGYSITVGDTKTVQFSYL